MEKTILQIINLILVSLLTDQQSSTLLRFDGLFSLYLRCEIE